MDSNQQRSSRPGERAATTLEYVALAVAVSLLLAAVGVGMTGQARPVSNAIASSVQRSIAAPTTVQHATLDGDKTPVAVKRSSGKQSSHRWRTIRERRASGGATPVRITRDELRLSPMLPPVALWQRQTQRSLAPLGIATTVTARACAACASLSWAPELRSGAVTGTSGTHTGLEAAVEASARLSIAAVDASLRAQRSLGPAKTELRGHVRGALGGEVDGRARIQLDPGTQDIELEGGAMAGAIARVEAQAGVELLGIAIKQSGRIEGWAGAGARGTIGVRRSGGLLEWRFGWGAALGLGGAGEWRGSVDVTNLPRRHRRLATRGVVLAAAAAGMPLPLAQTIQTTRSLR